MSKTTIKFSPEVRERAARMVLDGGKEHPSRWAAVLSTPYDDEPRESAFVKDA
ncbi:hypothetical protein [Qipengyuania flava]|uniref:hypothetical protein n=1 Tax=Qipengyuania flava TaxID=192812 RepID=UPI0018F8B36D|tara:strand:+ start:2367 stop:2525 length:159 start_codon:yes stop_codon:yes gene_type:complete